MALKKQAKILSQKQISVVLTYLSSSRKPERDKLMFLLSCKAGLRACEIAGITWGDVMDNEGNITDTITITDHISKGNHGGRTIPMHRSIKEALEVLYKVREFTPEHFQPLIYSQRGLGMSANVIAQWFMRIYNDMGFVGCSSHSGRRTFITYGAKKVFEAGGSLRDIQQLVGHANLETTQLYIEGDTEAKKNLIALI